MNRYQSNCLNSSVIKKEQQTLDLVDCLHIFAIVSTKEPNEVILESPSHCLTPVSQSLTKFLISHFEMLLVTMKNIRIHTRVLEVSSDL